MSRPKILITNDDGIHSPGIRSLWKAVAPFADVTIVAPLTDQSAISSAITLRSPLKAEKYNWDENTTAWCINGTTVDCVKLAFGVLLKEKPDMILSGINKGSNAGGEVLYSGTIGGVITGVLRGIQGIAFSCSDYTDTPFHLAEPHIPKIVHHLLENPLPHGTLLNVNFPTKLAERMNGFKMTRQGREHWIENPDLRYHPTEGNTYYWMGSKKLVFDEEHEDSDIVWLKQGFTTVVPVHVRDLTHQAELDKRKSLFDVVL